MQRTIKCKMAPNPAMEKALEATAKAFAGAANRVLAESRKLKTSNKVKLQHAVYREIRGTFGLSANLAIRAIARVAWAVKVAAKRHKQVAMFRPTSIDYDRRIFDYRPKDETVSLTTLEGRIHVPLVLGGFQRQGLDGKKPTCARVVHRDHKWEIHIVIEEADPPKRGGPPLGIDLGIRNIAVLSNGKRFSGAAVRAVKNRFSRIKASLQSKGTQGAKRVLRRLSGRERRFITWKNHNVAKRIVEEAAAGGFGLIRMEDLRGIRERTRTWNPHLNRAISGWSFGQLQEFVLYKGKRTGIDTEKVDPWRTSQTCHKCRRPGIRKGEEFFCATCGRMDADWNASRVIAAGGVELGAIPGDRNATRIAAEVVEFFSRSLHAKAAGL